MTLQRDLLDQALFLVNREPRRPRQASLRRAVSASYYALFHLLTEDASRRFFPIQPQGLKDRAKRAFAHGDMAHVCRQFAKGRTSELNEGTKSLISEPLESDLSSVAAAFVELQEARHLADYDMSASFIKPEALRLTHLAQTAFANWQSVRTTANATVFLAALMLQRQWNK
ncbi:MAG: hypothetical protein H5U13_00855 [Parvibaculum sp.]|nr:hypothetical protein [Parvibaculum sp.]